MEQRDDECRRTSLDVCCGHRQSTLLDDFERVSIEAQLNRAILRRSFSAPSPARFIVQSAAAEKFPMPGPAFAPATAPRERKPWARRVPRVFRRLFGPVFGRMRGRTDSSRPRMRPGMRPDL